MLASLAGASGAALPDTPLHQLAPDALAAGSSAHDPDVLWDLGSERLSEAQLFGTAARTVVRKAAAADGSSPHCTDNSSMSMTVLYVVLGAIAAIMVVEVILRGATRRTLSAEARTNTAPTELTAQNLLILAVTLLPIVVSGLTVGYPNLLLPEEAGLRGLSNAASGFMIAAEPFGMVAILPVVPLVVQHTSWDAVTLIRVTTAAAAIAAAAVGLAALIPNDAGGAFVVLVTSLRLLLGMIVSTAAVAQEMLLFCLLPEKHLAFGVSIVQTMQTLTKLAAPPLGAWLYEVGCWPLPFAVSGAIMGASSLLLLIMRGYLISPDLKPRHFITACDMLSVPDLWPIVLLSTLGQLFLSLFGPLIEPFLTAPPLNFTMSQVGLYSAASTGVIGAALFLGGSLVGSLGYAPLWTGRALLASAGIALIGPASFLLPLIPRSVAITIVGSMLLYTGLGLGMPANITINLHVMKVAGFTQKQVAGVLSSVLLGTYAIGTAAGAPIGGALYDAFGGADSNGFNDTMTVTFVSYFLVWVLQGYLICKYGNVHPEAKGGAKGGKDTNDAKDDGKGAKDDAEGKEGKEKV